MITISFTRNIAVSFLIIMSFVYSADAINNLNCDLGPTCLPGEIEIMGYDPNTNHASKDPAISPERLCCGESILGNPTTVDCSGTFNLSTSILRISAVTDALLRAELISDLSLVSPPYLLANQVCLKNDVNIARLYTAAKRESDLGVSLCPPGYDCALSMSAETGSNMSPCTTIDDNYPIQLCVADIDITSNSGVPLRFNAMGITGYEAICGVSDGICPSNFDILPGGCVNPGSDPDCFEDCTDGADNDLDGFFDCNDTDCCGHPYCWDKYATEGIGEDGFNDLTGTQRYAQCCTDGFDNDLDGFSDGYDPDDCDVDMFLGSFDDKHESSKNQIVVMDVLFADHSDLIDPTTAVTWDFVDTAPASECDPGFPQINILASDSFAQGQAAGNQKNIGTITLKAAPGKICQAEIRAVAQGDPLAQEFIGSFSLFVEPPGAICPECTVTEIPAVIHRIGFYSDRQAVANTEYNRAKSAYDHISSLCVPGGCGQDVMRLLSKIGNNVNAAKEYLDSCVDGSVSCKLSQYYSSQAISLLRDAQYLI